VGQQLVMECFKDQEAVYHRQVDPQEELLGKGLAAFCFGYSGICRTVFPEYVNIGREAASMQDGRIQPEKIRWDEPKKSGTSVSRIHIQLRVARRVRL
jgi:hypothetical protein